ncbi:MAG: hypothetical protein Ct9H300mP32_2350 [Verrucomicrobiota bacterium]|nr:MAG: hypothetical protein Ct9H300mP32_2350 [Verrucomicrobiota bacterium]
MFNDRVNCSGGTPLPVGKVHFIDLFGLDPSSYYELILFSSSSGNGDPKAGFVYALGCLIV